MTSKKISRSNVQRLIVFALRIKLKSKTKEERLILQKYLLIYTIETLESNIDFRNRLITRFSRLLN